MQKAKQQGDFLLVGVHTDEDVQERRGPHLPIMDLHERSLSVLACKYVDEVIIGMHDRLRPGCDRHSPASALALCILACTNCSVACGHFHEASCCLLRSFGRPVFPDHKEIVI